MDTTLTRERTAAIATTTSAKTPTTTSDTVLRVEAATMQAAREYITAQGFIELFPPRIVRASGACENIDTLFEVRVDGEHQWFAPAGRPTHSYLAQTGQLYLEAFVPSIKKVFCVGPSFRAEAGVDNRHLTEFTMLEIEFAGGFEELLGHIQGLVSTVAHRVAEDAARLELAKDRARALAGCPREFPRMTYDEAIATLRVKGENIAWGDDINSKREQILVAETGGHPLFITHYPDPMYDFGASIEVEKFFNMLPDPARPGRVQSADLILPVAGESVGAAARVHEIDMLVSRLQKSKMFSRLVARGGTIDDFGWYINHVRANGAVPHAGCGFGMSRILQWIHGATDIRHAVTFPQNQQLII